MIFPTVATLRFLANPHWEEIIPAAICMLFLMVLFWYLTVRICQDLTIRAWRGKFLAEQTRREAAERANQAKTEFLAGMSHEIRAPLNALVGFTELAAKTELNAELVEHLRTVRTSSQWLLHIANDVIEFSRAGAGRVSLKIEPFAVRECLESALRMVRTAAEARRVGLILRVDADVPVQMNGDSTLLLQVIFNLVENAVRSTTDGSVSVTVESVKKSDTEIVLGFVVEDTGVGVSSERLNDFFKPLTQPCLGGDQPDGEIRGAMLSAFGLPLCEQNVNLMGGTLEVKSHLGAGTAIRFSAKFQPVAEEKHVLQPYADAVPVVCSAARRLNILLADQNPISRRLTKAILEGAGHLVREAAEGPEALRLFVAAPVDLVLLDLEIAPIHGQEVTQALRSTEKDGVHTPIYALLSKAATLNRETCRAAGIHGFLSKPVDVDAVLNIVAAIALSQPQQTLSPGPWRLTESDYKETGALRADPHPTV